VHDQRTKDAQVVERSAKLKTPIIVLSFKQKKLRFTVVRTPLGNPRDVQLRAEQRLEDKDNRAAELIMDALLSDGCGDNKALEVQMTYQEVLDDVDKKLAYNKDVYIPRMVADLHLLLSRDAKAKEQEVINVFW
jgi:hypothetical protein